MAKKASLELKVAVDTCYSSPGRAIPAEPVKRLREFGLGPNVTCYLFGLPITDKAWGERNFGGDKH